MRTAIDRVRSHIRCVQVDDSKLVSLGGGRKELMLILIVRYVENPHYEAEIK
jgi:hypothetical protein